MIDTSVEYKTAILNNRILHHEAIIEFVDGATLTPKDVDLYTFKIAENTSNQNSFDIGSVIAKQLNLKISNINGEYNKHKLSGAKITAKVGLEISGKTEWLKKGVYYAEPGSFSGDTISVAAYDSITKFDTPYSESTLKYPATLGEIVRDACSVCDVAMSADLAAFSQSNLVVQSRPSDSSLTFRQVLQYVGEIACLFFKMNEDDRLTASWYDTDLLESEQVEENAIKIEHYTGTVETDDVVITGIHVVEDGSDSETMYDYGTAGYMLEIKENKLIQDGNGASVAEYVGTKINGLIFRPLTIKCQGDPAREAGDIAVVTDRKGNTYKTILTGVTYTAKAQQDLVCGAESPAQQSATRYSKATQVYRELRKTIRQQRTEFVKALESLQNAMDEKEGLYPITSKLENGSHILYFCDHKTLEESKVVIKLNAEGWGMSTDGGKTWNVGALVDGTTITKILSAIGINADWINVGTLSGKFINAKGMKVTDKGNKITLYIDEDGHVMIAAESFAVGGKDINAITTETVQKELKTATPLIAQLSSDYQAIPVDADGNYNTFPSCQTSIQVFYGGTDVTADATISISYDNTAGTWDTDTHTCTLSSLTADKGNVTFAVSYNGLTTARIFNVAKLYGNESTTIYTLEASATVVTRSFNSGSYSYSPTSVSFSAYSQTGNKARTRYSGGKLQVLIRGTGAWSLKGTYTSQSSCTFACTSLSSDDLYLRCDLYVNNSIVATKVISVVDDAKLTQQQVFDLLTNNGETQGIYIYNGKIYLNGTFLKSKSVTAEQIDVEDLYALAAKIGGWTINDTGLQSKAGKIKLLADGRIQIGNVILASDGDAFTVKNGLHIYAGTDTISDGTDKFKVFNLSHVTSGGHLVFASDGATVSYLSSSSKRYKDHVSDMTIEEAEKLLKIPVIWFKYKKGYLDESDWLNGKRLPGFYAEDIYDIFPEAAQLDEAGKPEDWNFRVMIPAILKLVQSQNERINNLCQRISKLEQLMEDKNE